MLRLALTLGLLSCLAPGVLGQLAEGEVKGVADSLLVGNLKLDDLKFERRQFKFPNLMESVSLGLSDPLLAADDLMRWHDSAEKASGSALLATAMLKGWGLKPSPLPPAPLGGVTGLWKVDPAMRGIVFGLVGQMQACDMEIRAATAKLNEQEIRELVEGLPQWATEAPEVSFDFVRTPAPKQARMVELVARVDWKRIAVAGQALAAAAEKAAGELKAGGFDTASPFKTVVNGLPVLICGKGNDPHLETEPRLTIDLGGDDVYRGRHGAGVGYSSVLIDLGGSDTYEPRDLSVGAAVLGVGIAIDAGGNDTVTGRSLCAGAALCGLGLFEKTGGNDHYSALSLAQGFGEFGVGVLVDSGGSDTYDIGLHGQGAARAQGVGWLVDQSGRDVYRAGGLQMNRPLFDSVAYSFAQGCGSGYREDSGGVDGGVGLLTDLAGDDSYLCETYGQAAAYWYSVGSLYDKSGNDLYSGTHYCQASAMHACGAYLFDLSGNDSYITKVGASLAIGQDYGVALLLDRSGDDIFAARDSTPGIGVANGLGIFVDSDGIDRFDGPPGQGQAARGTGSLGVFVDLGGSDKYRAGLIDGSAGRSDSWGTAYDRESAAETVATPPDQHKPPAPGSIPLPGDKEMEAVYRAATQWAVGTAQQTVADNVDKLIGIGVPALEWMLEHHLAKADRLELRAFVAVARALGAEAGATMGPKALRGSKPEKRNLVLIAIDAGIEDLAAVLPGMLEDPDLRDVAVRAAGPLKAVACIDGLNRLCLSDSPLLVRAAMVSLSQIGSSEAVGTAQAMLRSADFLTREAALALILKVPDQAQLIAATLAGDSDETRARYGLRILGKLGSPENLRAVASYLLDPRPGVRAECLLQLDGRCPQEYEQAMLSLKKDPVPVVRAVAKRVTVKRAG